VLRILTYVAFAVGLFACVWVSRVVLATPFVEYFTPIATRSAIALVAIVAGVLPALAVGIAYGAFEGRPILWKAAAVAFGAGVIELALASAAVDWWAFITWFVLPLECLTLLLCFPVVAWAVSGLVARVEPAARRRGGIILFVFILLCAAWLAWPAIKPALTGS
jgi:hypothetical protein